jgi:hypothetical protein
LLAALRQRQAVELIPPYPAKEDFFRVRCGADGAVVKRVADGLIIHCPARCGLVELLPEVPVRCYRVRARLRWETPLIDELLQWGVYVKHRRRVTHQGPQHYFVTVYFGRPVEVEGEPGPHRRLSGSFRPRLFGDLREPTKLPFRDEHGAREGPSQEGLIYIPDPVDRWVDVEITVNPARVAASFHPGGSPVAAGLPLLVPADEGDFKGHLRWAYPDLAVEQFEGSALGVYLRHAVCTVQGFAVEPIDG